MALAEHWSSPTFLHEDSPSLLLVMVIRVVPIHSLSQTCLHLIKILGSFACPLPAPKNLSLQTTIQPCFDLLRHLELLFKSFLR